MYIIWPFKRWWTPEKTLEEAVVSGLASQIRQLFATMFTACQIEQPNFLWDAFTNNMSEDFLNQARLQNENMSIEFCPEIYQ